MSRGSSVKGGKKEERRRRREERRAAATTTHSTNGTSEGGDLALADTNGTSDHALTTQQQPPAPRTDANEQDGEAYGEHEVFGGLSIYRPSQGYWVRMGTAVAVGLLVVLFAVWVFQNMALWQGNTIGQLVRVVLTVGSLAVGGWLTFMVTGRWHKSVDFFIATEGEMRKVNWATRKEVMVSTKVVIMMSVLVTLFLTVFNQFFIWLFRTLGVLRM